MVCFGAYEVSTDGLTEHALALLAMGGLFMAMAFSRQRPTKLRVRVY
jgi:hypothetical protein